MEFSHMDAASTVNRGQAKSIGGQHVKVHRRRKRFFDKYRWWFVLFGLFGNFLFFIGSICFLNPNLETFAISLFIAGSGIMLISYSAESIEAHARSILREQDGAS
jgi:hypothetical protein